MSNDQVRAAKRRRIARQLKLLFPALVIAAFLVVALVPELFARHSYSEMHAGRRLEPYSPNSHDQR